MKSAVIAYAFDTDRIAFFERFRRASLKRDIELVIITNRPALLRHYPLTRCLSRPQHNPSDRDDTLIYNSLEFRVGNRNLRAARRLVCSIEDCLHDLQAEYAPKILFIWNGCSLPERVMSRYASEHDIGTLYFENSNIPGKMIIDCEGVNAECSIARDPSLLTKYCSTLSTREFEVWKRNYIAGQRCSHKVHQASGVRQINWSFLYDTIGQRLSGIPQYEMYPFLTKVVRKLDAFFYRPKNRHLNTLPERFVFFPLQVQSDTQLIFNSDIGNEEALKLIFSQLETEQKLVVKQHPAEPSKRAQRRYSQLIEHYGGIEASNNIFELMLAAEKIYTINSTAGLQAKLMEKPVECLGKAVFADMDDELLNHYIHGFLTPIEFFDLTTIHIGGDLPILDEILAKAVSH